MSDLKITSLHKHYGAFHAVKVESHGRGGKEGRQQRLIQPFRSIA